MSGETESAVSGWTTDTLKVHLESLESNLEREVILARDALRELMDERDTRYREYVASHEEANTTLLARLEQTFTTLLNERDKRYSEHFAAGERAVEAALQAAQIATDKAEYAQEQRNNVMNQFREQLRQQAGEFATKDMVDRINVTQEERLRLSGEGMSKRLESAITAISDMNNRFTSFAAEYGGRTQEKASVKDDSRAMIATVVAILSVLLAIGGLAAGIIANAN